MSGNRRRLWIRAGLGAGAGGVFVPAAALAQGAPSVLAMIEQDATLAALAYGMVAVGGLLVVIAGVALPALRRAQQARERRIVAEVAEAERLRGDMAGIRQRLGEQVIQAHQQAQAMREAVERDIERQQQTDLAALDARIDREVKAAEERIAAARQAAAQAVPDASNALVRDLRGKLDS